jgi:hypothetical protein
MKMTRREREAMMRGLMALGQLKTPPRPQDINKFMTQGLQVVTGTKPTVDLRAFGGPLGPNYVPVTPDTYVPNQTQIRTGPSANTDPYPCGTPAMYGTYLCDDEFEHRLDPRAMTQGRDLSDSLATRASQTGDYKSFFDDWMSRFGPPPPPPPGRKGKEKAQPPQTDEEIAPADIPMDMPRPPDPPPVMPFYPSIPSVASTAESVLVPAVNFEELADELMGEMGRPPVRYEDCPAQDVPPAQLRDCSKANKRKTLLAIHPDLNTGCRDLANDMTQRFTAYCESQWGRDLDQPLQKDAPWGPSMRGEFGQPGAESGMAEWDDFGRFDPSWSSFGESSRTPLTPMSALTEESLLPSPEEMEEMDLSPLPPLIPFVPGPASDVFSEVPLTRSDVSVASSLPSLAPYVPEFTATGEVGQPVAEQGMLGLPLTTQGLREYLTTNPLELLASPEELEEMGLSEKSFPTAPTVGSQVHPDAARREANQPEVVFAFKPNYRDEKTGVLITGNLLSDEEPADPSGIPQEVLSRKTAGTFSQVAKEQNLVYMLKTLPMKPSARTWMLLRVRQITDPDPSDPPLSIKKKRELMVKMFDELKEYFIELPFQPGYAKEGDQVPVGRRAVAKFKKNREEIYDRVLNSIPTATGRKFVVGKGRSGGMNQDNQDPNAPPPIILRRQPGPPLNYQQILNVLDQGQYRNNDPSVFTDRMSPRGVRRSIMERRVAGEVLGDRLNEEVMGNLYDFI